MLTSIHIQGFKGFRDTKIDTLKRVNLVVGGQNVGKTSLLEAVWLGRSDIRNVESLFPTLFRSSEGQDDLRAFKTLDTFAVNIDGNDTRVISNDAPNVQFPRLPTGLYVHRIGFRNLTPVLALSIIPTKQVSLVHLMGQAISLRKKKKLIAMLSEIDPRLEDVEAISPDGEQRVYVGFKGESIMHPLPLVGHGFSRLLHIYSSLLVTNAKLALVDEIENGIHYSALPTVFAGIKNIAQDDDIQSIITTHSYECIRAAAEAFVDAPDDFQVIRLERTEDGNIEAISIPFDRVKFTLENNWEIR